MDRQELQQLAIRLGAFADLLEKQAAAVAGSMQQSGDAMARTAQGIAGQVQQLSQSVVSTVRTESRGAVAAGAQEGMAPALEQLQQTIRALQGSSQSLHAQAEALRGTRRSLVWLSSLALLVGSLLAAGGSGYLVWKQQRELRRAEFGLDILEASRSGALNRCGDALCARTGKNPEHYSRNSEYVLVK